MKKAFASFFQNIIIIVYNNTDMSMSSMEDRKINSMEILISIEGAFIFWHPVC